MNTTSVDPSNHEEAPVSQYEDKLRKAFASLETAAGGRTALITQLAEAQLPVERSTWLA